MRHALLIAWTKTLRRRGDDHAVVQAKDGAIVTFRELDTRADDWLAQHVAEPNSLQGRAVIFAAPNGIDWFEIFIGLLKAGAVVVPLDANEPPVAQRRLAVSIRAAAWWNGTKLELLPNARRYRDPSLCLIKLTSGTTGQPRALVFTANQLLADARQVTVTMGIRPRDLNYALIPLGHSYGLGNLTVPLLAHGVPLVCGSAPLPHAIATDFSNWQPTVFPGVPTMWRALAASDLALPNLRLAISAGAPLPPEVARNFAERFDQPLHNFYGSSETGGISYDRTGTATLAGHVGRALRGVQLIARSGQRLQVCSAAVLTHGNRQRGNWIMSDRAELDARGKVTLLGRRDSTVKIAGRRVNLGEVRERLCRLTGVRDAWVDFCGGAEPTLRAVLATDRRVSELRAELHADTAAWKVPKKITVMSSLPLTARGKIDTRALAASA
ncbi:MAG: class I adenylate-forming enzyme family protein [Candidatus Didemnitutus sp.]|nr:class I adenylate-forming enzyme family protein [Candidatus Didemnitutus sp.]